MVNTSVLFLSSGGGQDDLWRVGTADRQCGLDVGCTDHLAHLQSAE